jgi:hypothetical protein
MENWGLITYRETALLIDPQTATISNRQRVSLVVAHELVHQWCISAAPPLQPLSYHLIPPPPLPGSATWSLRSGGVSFGSTKALQRASFPLIQNQYFPVFTASLFFSYFEYEGMNGFMPDWKIFKDFNYNDRAGALAYDSSLGSHALSNFQPGPWSPGEIGSMFDSISCVGRVLLFVPRAALIPSPAHFHQLR